MDIRDTRGAPATGAKKPFEEMALFPFAAPWAEFMSKAFQPLAMPFSPSSLGGAAAPLPSPSAMAFGGPLGEYLTDCAQRTILFWDVLRRRSADYYAHREKSLPSVLMFDADVILDGRTFARPVNYILVKIRPPEGVVLDAKKRPFVVVDPRAGHGPGIGGFKADSELGVAMRAGHTCYFVGFYPEPVPRQTIEDIMHAEALFLEKIHKLHPDAEGKPCVIGNCQAGWAVMMLAAVRPELFGPIIVPGSPLSYWAGVKGKNPMRYTGGLMGGSWLTAMASDLAGGKFHGRNLVSNFENLNPSNTHWSKNYNIWSNVDTEAERFLEFERWWGAHVNLNGEEIQWIVDQLFIGNRLATGELTTSDGVRIDLSNIRSPIVCFCSEGDNITPPQQALGWIVDLYERDDDLKAHNQTIVYCIHKSTGHLGIFVSGGVANKEHQEFASNIDLIDVLPPGLYELVLTPKSATAAGGDYVYGEWISRFERRTLADVRAIVQPNAEDERRFATVRRVSEVNLGLYRTMLQPFVKAWTNDQTVDCLNKTQMTELPYLLFSDKNPLMQEVARLAEQVRAERAPTSADNPFVQFQEAFSRQMVAALDAWRDFRDQSLEQLFLAVYGNPVLQAMVGLRATDDEPRRRPGLEPEEISFIKDRLADLKARIGVGGLREAVMRGLVYIGLAGPGIDERVFNVLNDIRGAYGDLSLADFKMLLREQFFALILDQKAALAAIPAMLPKDAAARKTAVEQIRAVVTASGTPEGTRAQRLAEVEAMFAAV
ncbi:MAG: DUF3141 domain-containing protein [Defluviicoccus sp.]